jgi:hypothetical protein
MEGWDVDHAVGHDVAGGIVIEAAEDGQTQAEIVRAAQQVAAGSWQQMQQSHGDWGRDGTMYVAVRYGGYRLAEVAGGIEVASRRPGGATLPNHLGKDAEKTRFVDKMKVRLAKSAAKA